MRTLWMSLVCASVFSTTPLFPASAAAIPRPAPPFSIMRIGSTPLKVSAYKGKIVALTFIYTTCPHCQHLTSILNQVAKDYTSRGVQILECAFNDDAVQTMPEFVQRYSPAFPIGFAARAAVMSYLQYSPNDTRPLYVPHMVFIDRTGMIRSDYPGEGPFFQDPDANVRKELDKLLKSSNTASASPAKTSSFAKK